MLKHQLMNFKGQNHLLSLLLSLALMITILACQESDSDQLSELKNPEVATRETSAISYFSAISGGSVAAYGHEIIARGICWDTIPYPTIFSHHRFDSTGSVAFDLELTDLEMGKTYGVRAFIITATDTTYGQQEIFETLYSHIRYVVDGRYGNYGYPTPLLLSLDADSKIDFTIFIEAAYLGGNVQLAVGINPIELNTVKSSAPNDDRFLNMGLIIPTSDSSLIDETLQENEYWTSDHSALVIRYTDSNENMTYEGAWASETRIAPVQFYIAGQRHFGWLRIQFLDQSNSLQLIDYAYNALPDAPIRAGQKL